MICAGTGCVANGSLKVKDALETELIKRNLQNEIKIVLTGCNGFCAKGPVIVVYPEDIFYQLVKPADVPYLVEEHFIKGRPVQKFLYTPPTEKTTIPVMNDIPFFKHQVLRALRNRSLIDAEKIEEYIARDGYMAAAKALTEMTPEQIVAEVKRSGLRGRGGAGFLTGLKWELCARVTGDIKYILCNGDEGDPGAFMDRSVMEADPHSVLEGMIIAAKGINAHYGYIYVRAEYPLAVHRLQIAIDQAKERGLLGNDILGTGFDLDIEIYQGAGAFVCGEETALMASIEGKRGMPRAKPPFPAVKGLWMRPSVLNNVETFANVPPIILNGADWFSSLGTEKSKGTKVFALSGALNNIGLVEVPMGTPLKTMIFDIGGGIKNNRKFKAVQMGGPSGGCIPHIAHRYARGLREHQQDRRDHGVRRHGGDGRDHVHAGHGKVLPRVHRGRILRQVRALPDRQQNASFDPHPDHERRRPRGRYRAFACPFPADQGHLAVRTGPDLAQPGAYHDQVFPRRVRGAHQGAPLSGQGLHAPRQVRGGQG